MHQDDEWIPVCVVLHSAMQVDADKEIKIQVQHASHNPGAISFIPVYSTGDREVRGDQVVLERFGKQAYLALPIPILLLSRTSSSS